MTKVEHIGIAVKSLEDSNELFEKLLGVPSYKTEKVESEGVNTSFFQCGETKIELLEATNNDSVIRKFIDLYTISFKANTFLTHANAWMQT